MGLCLLDALWCSHGTLMELPWYASMTGRTWGVYGMHMPMGIPWGLGINGKIRALSSRVLCVRYQFTVNRAATTAVHYAFMSTMYPFFSFGEHDRSQR